MREPGVRAVAKRLQRVGLKQCACCHVIKVLRAFFKRSPGCSPDPDARYSECKVCHITRTDAWRESHPDRYREIARKARRKYAKKMRKAARA